MKTNVSHKVMLNGTGGIMTHSVKGRMKTPPILRISYETAISQSLELYKSVEGNSYLKNALLQVPWCHDSLRGQKLSNFP